MLASAVAPKLSRHQKSSIKRRRDKGSVGNHVEFSGTVTNLESGEAQPLRTGSSESERRFFPFSISDSEGSTGRNMQRHWEYNAPIGHRILERLAPGGKGFSLHTNRFIVLILTFLCYSAYHASRKPPSIVKSVLHGEAPSEANANESVQMQIHGLRMAIEHKGMFFSYDISDERYPYKSHLHNKTNVGGKINPNAKLKIDESTDKKSYDSPGNMPEISSKSSRKLLDDLEKKHPHPDPSPPPPPPEKPGWKPFNNPKSGKSLLGDLDVAFLGSYALGMFISGHLGDRLDLRHFLTWGMIGSGACVALFGMAYFWEIHIMPYFLTVQVVGGLLQATGWPSVVSVMANWFGKGKRGLVMGIWNAHTSVGNIAGSLMAAAALQWGWGWSFVVPGAMIAGVGLLIFLFLVVEPQDIGFVPQSGSALGSAVSTCPCSRDILEYIRKICKSQKKNFNVDLCCGFDNAVSNPCTN